MPTREDFLLSFDPNAHQNAEDAEWAFLSRVVAAKDEVIAFVRHRMGWKTAEFDRYFKGSFNLGVCVKNRKNKSRVVIRFPLEGKVYGPWREKKVEHEVMAMRYISQHTTIPVPRVYSWGLAKDSPGQLGPFMIEEFMPGKPLGDVLRDPTRNKALSYILDPAIDDAKLDFVYEQLAKVLLGLSRLRFPRIGAMTQEPSTGKLDIRSQPLTYDMNEIVTSTGMPADLVTTASPFHRSTDYFAYRTRCIQAHLETQLNITGTEDPEVTWKRYVARQCLPKLIPKYCDAADDCGPFRLFCDDLRPSNILVDPRTLRITAVLDLEFANAMPAQFAYDVPWWLVLQPPGPCLSYGKQEFLKIFEPRKDQFLRAMQRAEAKLGLPRGVERRLSERMRESYDSGRFWFNLAMRGSFDVDEIYWNVLHTEGMGEEMLDEKTLQGKEMFTKQKKEQLRAYWDELHNDSRFRSDTEI